MCVSAIDFLLLCRYPLPSKMLLAAIYGLPSDTDPLRNVSARRSGASPHETYLLFLGMLAWAWRTRYLVSLFQNSLVLGNQKKMNSSGLLRSVNILYQNFPKMCSLNTKIL